MILGGGPEAECVAGLVHVCRKGVCPSGNSPALTDGLICGPAAGAALLLAPWPSGAINHTETITVFPVEFAQYFLLWAKEHSGNGV